MSIIFILPFSCGTYKKQDPDGNSRLEIKNFSACEFELEKYWFETLERNRCLFKN